MSVTKDLTSRIQAGRIVKEIAPIVGGGGGGRPDFAEAGGKDPSKIDELLAKAPGARRIAFVIRCTELATLGPINPRKSLNQQRQGPCLCRVCAIRAKLLSSNGNMVRNALLADALVRADARRWRTHSCTRGRTPAAA